MTYFLHNRRICSSLHWSFFCFLCCFVPTGVYSEHTSVGTEQHKKLENGQKRLLHIRLQTYTSVFSLFPSYTDLCDGYRRSWMMVTKVNNNIHVEQLPTSVADSIVWLHLMPTVAQSYSSFYSIPRNVHLISLQLNKLNRSFRKQEKILTFESYWGLSNQSFLNKEPISYLNSYFLFAS